MDRIITLLLVFFCGVAVADDLKEYSIVIENHQFTPSTIEVESGKRFKLKIENRDKTTEEFESKKMLIEKIIAGGKAITVTLGPLKPGEYAFEGEFNPKTAQGKVIAK